ncbi:DUF4159 domain-containing protein [Gemmatimonas phototrophica]|uniref:DUF4159 domain-containing protein n=1 Tax=Gemmatimonas phototrophica TaxID=1379270 RepID=A0A143BMR5_9BACT|nr:DUF4159 domain-containing protein [Gemmatimonas phototrophica]AMW05865.1 hypothetical protein GEMMAAP_15835 [Gemmatimonas phototrophica]
MRRWRGVVLALVLLATGTVLPADAGAQRRRGAPEFEPNVPYDGRFTWVRVKYIMPDFSSSSGFRGGRDLPWSHDYPRGERNFTKIVSTLSTARVRTGASNILTLDDAQLGKYPVAYMAEPGFWRPNDKEVLGLRNYLAKGGFIIFDDFAGQHWLNFESQMKRVLPNVRAVPLDLSHPIFDSFYKIRSLDYTHPYYGLKAVFYGFFEDNDPRKRLLAIANYNNDLSEMWEFSDEGFFPVDMSNEAYKLGVNYVIYALTR